MSTEVLNFMQACHIMLHLFHPQLQVTAARPYTAIIPSYTKKRMANNINAHQTDPSGIWCARAAVQVRLRERDSVANPRTPTPEEKASRVILWTPTTLRYRMLWLWTIQCTVEVVFVKTVVTRPHRCEFTFLLIFTHSKSCYFCVPFIII